MLKDLRFYGTKWYSIVPMCLALLMYTSCGKNSNRTVTPAKVASVSGETLFRGIVFNSGEMRNSVPVIAQQTSGLTVSPAEQITIDNVQNEIVSNINKINPGFFSHFKDKMTSGNRSEIAATLDETRSVVYDAIKLNNNIPNQLLDPQFLMKVRKLFPENIEIKELRTIVQSKRDEIKDLIASEIAPAGKTKSASPFVTADTAADVNETLNLNVQVQALAFYLAVAVFITLGAVIAAVFVADSYDSDTEGTTYPGKQNDLLLKEQIVNSIASSLSVSGRVVPN